MALYKLLDPRVDSLEYVRKLRERCLALALEGKTLVEYSAEGSSARKEALVPIETLLYETRMFIRDATGQYPIDQVKGYYV